MTTINQVSTPQASSHDTPAKTDWVEQGRQAYAAGIGRQDHGIRSVEVYDWLRGWEEAKGDAEAKAAGKVAMPSEFPTQAVAGSYSGISHHGDDRARMDRDAFVETVQKLYDDAKALVETDAQSRALDAAIKVFKDEYLAQTRSLMNVRAGTYSGFVAGRAKLNAKQANSRNSALDKAIDRFIQWEKGAAPKVKEAVLAARTPEQVAKLQAEKEAKQAEQQEKRLRRDLDLMAKILAFKNGETLKIGPMVVTKVNKDKEGYPLSLTIEAEDGSPLTNDKLNLASTVFGSRGSEGLRIGKEKIRRLVHALSDQGQNLAKSLQMQTPPCEAS